METFQFEWMNGGQAFDFSAARLSLHAYRLALAAKAHTLIEATKGLTNATVQEVKEEVLAEARRAALMEQMNVLVFDALCQVDKKVEALGLSKVIALLGRDDFLAVSRAVGKGLKTKAEPGEVADPNVDSLPK
ncbi:MAG: hypothetical protein LC623_05680 [Halobacteriales archaeon]|nr:hypothetical protein [Halobacteriales archaeon]